MITPIIDKNLCIKESIIVTICLYDIEKEQKLSEDYSFFIQSKSQKLPKIVESQLDHPKKECIFSIKNPTTSLILFISVDKIIKNKEESNSKKLLKDSFLFVSKKESWGFLKLCYSRLLTEKQNFLPSMLKEELIPIDNLFKYKDEKTDISHLNDCFKKDVKEIEKKYQKTDLPLSFETFIFYKDKPKNGLSKIKANNERFFIDQELPSLFVISNMLEIPKPFLYPQNKLYVYPQVLNVKNGTKYMNFKVGYHKTDTDLTSYEKRVYSKVPSEYKDLSQTEYSSLGFGTSSPKTFIDEFIIELPQKLEEKNHLLFTIYNYDDNLSKREIYGYCYLPFFQKGTILNNNIYSLDIYPTIEVDYLSNPGFESKGKLEIKPKLLSTYYSNNSVIIKLLTDKRNQNYLEFSQIILGLQPNDKETIFAYFPEIMNVLFKYLESISDYKHSKKVWYALLFLIGYIENQELFNWYAAHIYKKSEGFSQLFRVIPKFITRFITKGKMEIDYDHKFLFDLIIKNLTEQINRETFKFVSKEGLIDAIKDLDEKFLGEIEYLTKIISDSLIKKKNIQGTIVYSHFLFELIPIIGTKESLKFIELFLSKIACVYDITFEFFKVAVGKANWIPLIMSSSNSYLFSSFMKLIFENSFETNVIGLLMNHIAHLDMDERFKDLKVKNDIFSLYFKITEYFILNNQFIEKVKQSKDLISLLSILITIFKNQNEKFISKWLYKSQLSSLLTFLKYLRVFCTYQKKENPSMIYTMNQILSIMIQRKSFPSLKDTESYLEGITYVLIENLTSTEHTKDTLFDSFLRVNELIDRFDNLLIVKECKSRNLITKGEYCWRLLNGAILLNTSFPLNQTHPFIADCFMKLTKGYSEKFDKELEEFTFDEDVLLDKKDKLKAASKGKLISLLFDENMKFEQNYEKTFLLTYQSFMTPEELFFGLLTLYHKNFKGNQLSIIRVINLLVDLVKTSFYYLDNHVLSGLIHFLTNEYLINTLKTAHKKLKKNLITKLMDIDDERKNNLDQNVPRHIVPKEFEKKYLGKPNMNDYPFNFLEWNTTELANQMCLIESDLFKKIEPRECFGLGFSKPNRHELAPNITQLSDRFNRVCNWIQASILKEKDVKKRQITLQKWIDISKVCRQNNNFATLNQIFGSLNLSAIHRLKLTWENISDEDKKFLEEVGELFSNPPYPNLKKALLDSSGKASVPFFGMYQTELTFIEDGNPNEIQNNEKGLVNFAKRRLYYETLKNIQMYQQQSYNFAILPYLNYHLINMKDEVLKENDYYEMSLILEPKK